MYYKLLKQKRTQIVACIIFAAIFIIATPVSAFADNVTVVANKGIAADSITKKQAKKIWLGKTKSLAGTSLKTADLPKGNDSRKTFYKKVVKKNEKKLKVYWAKIVFSGKGTPPKSLGSDAEVLDWVAATPGAVGYVNSSAVNDSVKALLVSQ